MSVYAANKETLAWFKSQLPQRDNEPPHLYLARIAEAGLVRVLDRTAARDPRQYREAVAEADRARVPLLLSDPLPKPLDPSKVVRLSRTAAKDPYVYRAARAKAEELGAALVFVDE